MIRQGALSDGAEDGDVAVDSQQRAFTLAESDIDTSEVEVEVEDETIEEEVEEGEDSEEDSPDEGGGEENEEESEEDEEAGDSGDDVEEGEEDSSGDLELPVAVKIDGEEKEVPLSTLIERYQKEESADKRFQEVAEHRRQLNDFYERLVEDPLATVREVLAVHHKSPVKADDILREATTQHLHAILQEEALPEDERNMRRLQRERNELENRYKEEKNRNLQFSQQAEYEARKDEALLFLDQELADRNIPEGSPEDVEAQTIIDGHIRGGKNATEALTKRILDFVEEKVSKIGSRKISRLTAEDVIRDHPDLVKGIRKIDLQKMKADRSTKGQRRKKSASDSSIRTPRRRAEKPKYYRNIKELHAARKRREIS